MTSQKLTTISNSVFNDQSSYRSPTRPKKQVVKKEGMPKKKKKLPRSASDLYIGVVGYDK